ncbi:MAG TPA: IS200/IS605 family transposase [Chthoniobacterales bacterium]
MGSTHLSLYYHIVFGTKHLDPVIGQSWRERLHAFLGGIVRSLDGVAIKVGGVSDHVHLLVRLRAATSLADVLREIKSRSSKWVHEEIRITASAWQEGYGAFTVSSSAVAKVAEYIEHQEEHHRTRTFREEYVQFLERNGIEFDPKYLE